MFSFMSTLKFLMYPLFRFNLMDEPLLSCRQKLTETDEEKHVGTTKFSFKIFDRKVVTFITG